MWQRATDLWHQTTEQKTSHQTDIGQSVRSAAALLGHQLTIPLLKLQQPQNMGTKVVTNKKSAGAQKRLGNRETHTVKLSLNQSKKADRPSNQQHQTGHQTIPAYQGYVILLKQKKFALLLKNQLKQHLRQQGSTKPQMGAQVLRP